MAENRSTVGPRCPDHGNASLSHELANGAMRPYCAICGRRELVTPEPFGGAAGGKDAEVERLRAVLPKAWNVLGLVDKLKQGDTFVAKELRDELIALARPAGEGEG